MIRLNEMAQVLRSDPPENNLMKKPLPKEKGAYAEPIIRIMTAAVKRVTYFPLKYSIVASGNHTVLYEPSG